MSRVIPIDDPDDPRIADYREVRERDLVGRRGLVMAEGEVVLNVLVRGSRHQPLSLLLAEKRIEGLGPLIDAVAPDVPVYAASQAVLDAIAGFPLHRGVLAMAEKAPEPDPDALLAGLPERAVILVLCGVSNHDNIGGIFRNAAAFGVDALLLDQACCDPLYRKAIRVSVGAALRLPFARLPAGADPVAMVERHGFAALALSPSGATPLAKLARPPRAALLLGAEGPGLPAEVLDRARGVSLPMAEGWDSLNVATTSGIVLHHLLFMAKASR